MPVLHFKPGRVEEVIGLPLSHALELVEKLKIEAEVREDGYVEFEIEVDRPDMYSLEGIARQARGLLGKETGLPRYEIIKTDYVIEVGEVPSRPYIAGAVVWDVDVDEDFLEELIQFQEKLNGSIGGERVRVAIGLHDLDKVPSSKLTYDLEDIDRVVFVPLGGVKETSLREVLRETEQGKKYGRISLHGNKHPVIRAGEKVISVPPVINAELTRVEPGTKNLFIDVTGTELKPVIDVLSILAANLAERSRSKRIGLVTVRAPWGSLQEPKLEPTRMVIKISDIQRVLGLELDDQDVVRHLERMRFSAHSLESGRIEVVVPRYRIDILHPVDIAEEVILSIGLEKIAPRRPRLMLRGRLLYTRYWEREARKILAGLGFVEVVTYTLVPCDYATLAGVDESSVVKIANPIGVESGCVRMSLMPGLLRLASLNQHNVPLRIFEIGEVYLVSDNSTQDVPVAAKKKLSILVMGSKAGYEDIQAVVYTLIHMLGDEILVVKKYSHPILIGGRTALVKTKKGCTIVLGEVKPETLEELGMEYPVAIAEIDYTGLIEDHKAMPRP